MADYLYEDDGKIHTRYSELIQCTAGGIDRVLAQRQNPEARFESDSMKWGTDRHEMWQEETERTGLTPACFAEAHPQLAVSHCEEEFATEILPGVILHSRPDAICANDETIVDYKTMIAGSIAEARIKAHAAYGRSRQLPTYGFQVGLHNIKIRKAVYLIEVWKRPEPGQAPEEILGYVVVKKDLALKDLAANLPWVKERVSMLAAALDGAFS
jgi:hypothetical protein